MTTTLNAEPVQKIPAEPDVTSSKSIDPTKLGLNAAARLTGASKNTISKYAEDGTLSWELNAQGNKVFQVAELQRVFPKMKVQTGSGTGAESRREPPKNGSNDNETAVKIAVLEGEKRTLEAQLKAEREKGLLLEEIAQKAEQNATDLRQALKMLTYTPEPVAPTTTTEPQTQQTQRGFFGRLFKGNR